MMRSCRLRPALGLALLLSAAPALCGTFTTGAATVSVNTTINSYCAISATPITFGSYDPIGANSASGVALTASGTISLTCLKGSSPTIDLDAGLHVTGSQRRMLDGTSGDFLNYGITQPATTTPWTSCAGSTVWGSTVGGSVYTPSGVTWSASSTFSFNVCGSVPSGQNPSVGTGYLDTVVATVNF
jgi:spore coat protein U-like protein